jgi:hypothetical protein
MPARKTAPDLRSGRFKAPAADFVMIHVVNASAYRAFNTGDKKFRVKVYTGAGAESYTTVVQPKCSLDFRVPQNGSVKIDGDAATPTPIADIEGVFDFVGGESEIRNGRFDTAAAVTILRNRDGALYRIINGGDEPVTIASSATGQGEVKRNCSRDLAIPAADFTVTPATGFRAIGAYDNVSKSSITRSGRFKFNTGASNDSYLIIDLGAASDTQRHRYRVTNGGNNPFDVVRRVGTTNTTLATLQRDQSVDFLLSGDDAPLVTIVGAAASTVLTGIYDHLGSSN